MKTDKKTLALTAAKARLLAVQMVYEAASGHPGGSLSCLDVLTTLYFAVMNVDVNGPRKDDRDRFVMSKGHCSPAVYPVLALRGFFPVEEAFVSEEGKQYAYIYPGMNRVFQAAGRVIRREDDRGVIVLIDDRFDDPIYKKTMPALWRGMKFIPNAQVLREELDRFWREVDSDRALR